MPLSSLLLQSVSAIDPMCQKHSLSLTLMKGLPDLVTNVISVEEREAFDLEVHRYHATNLRQPQENEPIDKWWVEVKNSNKFPLVSRMACALLTCFHGPKVESSFSIMNSVVTSSTNRLTVESFDAIQTVKYELMSQKKSAVELFRKKDYVKDKVDKNLCRNMNSASKNYREVLLSQKSCDKQSSPKRNLVSKEAAKKICAKAAKLQRNIHLKKINSQVSKSLPEFSLQSKASANVTDARNQTLKRQLSDVNERPVKKQKASNVSRKGPLTIKEMFSKKY